MRIEMTLRATFIFQNADGELKHWLTEVLAGLKSGKDLPAESLRSEPNVFFVRFKDYRLVFKREADVVEVQDILKLHKELQWSQ